MPRESESHPTVHNEMRHGMDLIRRLPEVREEEASGQTAEIFEDIRSTLRVPFVNFIFRSLANDPDELSTLWYGYRSVFRTVAFEEAADDVRRHALMEGVSQIDEREWGDLGDTDRIRSYTDSIHYVLPKLLLVACAFTDDPRRRAASSPAPPSDRPTLPEGPAEGTVRVPMVDPEEASPRVGELFEEIQHRHRHPSVASYYRALGNWPDFLEFIWDEVRPRVGTDAYEGRKRQVIVRAEDATDEMLEGNVATPTNQPKASGNVKAMLAVFKHRLISDLLLDVTMIQALLAGEAYARRSQFSAADQTRED